MIPLIFWSVYLTGSFALSIPTMRFAAGRVAHCHQETKFGSAYKWHEQSRCQEYCKPGCWRVDDHVDLQSALWGLLAFAWPILLLPCGAWYLANRKPINHKALPKDLDSRIDELERKTKVGPYSELR